MVPHQFGSKRGGRRKSVGRGVGVREEGRRVEGFFRSEGETHGRIVTESRVRNDGGGVSVSLS